MKYFLHFSLACWLFSTALFSQNTSLIFSPAISPNGQTVAFNYQGDIWTIGINGENLNRLTIHEGYDTNPMWSNDGKTIAFQSNRFGNNDIFTISSSGGVPNRLTYHSANDVLTDFTSENTILFSTSRDFQQVEREQEVFTVNASGGTPYRLLNALGFDAKLSPNKKFIVLTKGYARTEREAYNGPANRDIWLYNIDLDKYIQLTNFQGQDFSPQWANNSTIYYQSAQSGKYNIHKLTINEQGNLVGNSSQETFLTEMGVFSFNLSKNGTDLVYAVGDKLNHFNTQTKKTSPINVEISSDYRFDPTELKMYNSDVSDVKVSPNGKYSILEIRGELFIMENDADKTRTVNVSNSPYKDFDAIWLNNETILFASDRNGATNFYTVSSSSKEDKNIFTSLKHTIKQVTFNKEETTKPVLAPNGKLVAYNLGYGNLVVASISENGEISNKKTVLNGWDTPNNVAWSPDSNWITYNVSDLYFNDEIYIHKADNSQAPVNISMHPKSDTNAIWSKDGSKIVFSSNRNNGDHDIWFVWLKKEDWEKTKQDWEETSTKKSESKKEDDASKDDEKTESVNVVIDFKDIHKRQQQVTSFNGGEYLSDVSKDGKTFYYTTGNSGRGNPDTESDLFQISWDGKDKKQLTSADTRPRGASLNKKEDYLYYVSKGRVSRIKLAGEKKESLSFSAKMIIDYTEESNQIFEDAWKAINDRFYDPNHHGKNWDKLKQQYKPLALKASTRDDFKTIFNLMLGQINASHMGMYRGEERADTAKETTGILGIELKPNKNGVLQVTSITPNSAADRAVSKLVIGDQIISVNGNKLTASENIYKHLNFTANTKIILGVKSNGVEKEVVIRPKSSNRDDNYNAWVEEQKRLTQLYSNGKLGYIHIQGMNWESFEHFERELTAAGHGKEGIVIDVRFNGGGWTTDYLMAVLNVQQHAYTIPRGAAKNLEKEHSNFTGYYPYSERLPLAAWTKPSVALCNEFSYSNAEIFSHAYKELKIGKLVGKPTFGAVISTGGHTLIDGSYVRIPFRGWFVKSSKKNMDFTPATPDFVLENYPDEKAKGTDSQLKKAVDELLKDLNRG